MNEAKWFPRGCVASPHHLATAVGAAVLSWGGNAVDAAVAANLVLGVVTPYHCGPGGDLLALVWDGEATGVMSVGRSPEQASLAQVREALEEGADPVGASMADGMPAYGALPVTVPGAVAGWFHLLARWGSRPFAQVAAPAIGLAREGFPVSPHAVSTWVAPGLETYGWSEPWRERYGSVHPGDRLRQPQLAQLLERLAADGPGVLYGGEVGEAIVTALRAGGSEITSSDLAGHRVEEVEPLRIPFLGAEVLELPPPTQGVSALQALGTLTAFGDLPDHRGARSHLAVEAVKAALADRDRYVTDPAEMPVAPRELLDPSRLASVAGAIDPDRASAYPPAVQEPGGTAYLCAADDNGLIVSLIQSNYLGFGSGIHVAEWGLNLHDRGASFRLDPSHVNVFAGGKQPRHTLIPAMALRDGTPWLAFGTMGGDGQAQTHVQLLLQMLADGLDPQQAVAEPRWWVSPDSGEVVAEESLPGVVAAGLADRDHRLHWVEDGDPLLGHAHAIEAVAGGYRGASDPRTESAVAGH